VKDEHVGIDMFSREHRTKRTERKSFFRRLAEKNGSPAIDWEEVVWARKGMRAEG
jgi:macrodomain Ter protein organizer (MatP/YcbG family)